ncbi:DUF3021 family protein [Caproicibacter sp.]|uniref:DUF3021 family protein n=1 Tax=Caproicibacter sp. TaxID=2814884 RepID=UPI003989CD20
MFRSFFVITTGVVASMYLYCALLSPGAVFTVKDIGRILLMAFVGDLPLLLFWSRRELSKRRYFIRRIVHMAVLALLLLYFASLWDWISLDKAGEVAVFLLCVLAVYVIVMFVAVLRDKKLSDRMNRKLKERYHTR